MPSIEPLAVASAHGHEGCLVEALVEEEGQQGGQNAGVVGMVGISKARKI